MNKLINELLLLAKIENVDNVKEYQQLNLSKEIEIILSMFESMAYEKQVNITSKITENIKTIWRRTTKNCYCKKFIV